MTLQSVRFLLLSLLLSAGGVFALEPIHLPTAGGEGEAAGSPHIKPFDYPADLRSFRARAIKADGYFVPDIAFSVRTCPKCGKQYVFGIYPRLTRTPFDSLAAVEHSIEESLRKPAPTTMFSPQAGKSVPRACPYCGEPEKDAQPNRVYFCHFLADSGDDLHIDYTVAGGKPAEHVFWRVPKTGDAVKVPMTDESETAFKKGFGCHFSLRAVWNDVFAAHWNEDKVYYENAAPGVWLIFRPEKMDDAAFKEFADKQLKPDRDKGLFSRLESPLKVDAGQSTANTYIEWAAAYAEKLSSGKAECFIGVSLPELRAAAVIAAESRNAKLTLTTTDKPNVPGMGFMERGPLKMPVNLAPLVKLAATGGLSLQQTCSFYLGEGSYALESAERLGKGIQAVLPGCTFEFQDGGFMIARDSAKQERKVGLLTLAGKLDPGDPVLFGIYRDYFLRWDAVHGGFGPAPLEREISPIGMPAFIERRIRPAEHLIQKKVPGALFEPLFDAEGKRCDICYTSECIATIVYVDPTKERFKDIPNVDAARRLAFSEGDILPTYVENMDMLRFPGGVRGLLDCRTPIFYGSDVSSLAADAGRASALADFGEVPEDTARIHFYAFTTNCAALAPRKLTGDEFDLLKSRVANFLKETKAEPGLELNLHFDLPRTTPKGRVLRRKQ